MRVSRLGGDTERVLPSSLIVGGEASACVVTVLRNGAKLPLFCFFNPVSCCLTASRIWLPMFERDVASTMLACELRLSVTDSRRVGFWCRSSSRVMSS